MIKKAPFGPDYYFDFGFEPGSQINAQPHGPNSTVQTRNALDSLLIPKSHPRGDCTSCSHSWYRYGEDQI